MSETNFVKRSEKRELAKTVEDRNKEDDETPQMTSLWMSQRARQFTVKFFRGFVCGVGVYSGIKIVTTLMRNPFRDSLPKIRAEILAKDGLQFATFLGLYPSIYDLMVELFEHFRDQRDDWNSALAGGVAGLSIIVEDRTRRRVYCLFAIARAIGAMISTLVQRGIIPAIPHSETALFCVCCSFLVYCTALKPQYLLKGYYRSILKWSRDYTDEKLTRLFRQPGNIFLTCADAGLHEHSCFYHSFTDFLKSMHPFAMVYLPIHMAPFIFFRYKDFWKRPKSMTIWLLKNIIWSTVFLSSMVALAKYVLCLLRNIQHRPPPLSPWIPTVAGAVAGLGVLFERVDRRRELLLFLIPHTLYAVYLWAKEIHIIRSVPHSSLILYALAMIPIMHAYEREPESLSLLLHSALKFFVGNRKSTVERIKRRTVSEVHI